MSRRSTNCRPAARRSRRTSSGATSASGRTTSCATRWRTGNQAFIICPLVEESETLEAKSAVAEHERLQETVFPELSLGLLHGKMPPRTKDRVMTAFRDGEYHVLVATSVVEVGIDVPNATVMLIEGADRFGLSQLHQFRGRVGRGRAMPPPAS